MYPTNRKEGISLTERALDELARRVMLDAARQEYGELIDEQPEHDFSPEFERRMKKLIRRADHPIRWRWMWVGRAAALLAALLMLVTVAAAAGCELWGLLALWTSEQITLAPGQIDYMDPDDLHIPEEPGEYASIQEALSAYGFDRPVVPRCLPDGFTLENLVVDDRTRGCGSIVFFAAYCRGEDRLIQQVEVYLEQENREQDNFGHFQKDEGNPIPYEAGGVTHLLATNAGWPVALWANGPAECAISGDITMEELKAMLDSIYERQ